LVIGYSLLQDLTAFPVPVFFAVAFKNEHFVGIAFGSELVPRFSGRVSVSVGEKLAGAVILCIIYNGLFEH